MFFKNSEVPQDRSRPAAGSRTAIPSLLSAGIRIKGDVNSSGEIQVDGIIEGDISAACVVVSEAGTVSGTIAAPSVRILGTVTGTITAGTIKLARTARVTGDIVHDALAIEEGAFVLGHCSRAEPDTAEPRSGDADGEGPSCAGTEDDGATDAAGADDDGGDDAGEAVLIPTFVR